MNNKAHGSTICRFIPDEDDMERLTSISDSEPLILNGSSDILDFGAYIDQVTKATWVMNDQIASYTHQN